MDFRLLLGFHCIFAGCLINNISLEHIVRLDRSAGSFVTFAQVLFVAVEGLLAHLSISRSTTSNREPRHPTALHNDKEDEDDLSCGISIGLKARKTPILFEPDRPWYRSWRTYGFLAALQFVVSLMINEAFGYRIQMPVHVVFRTSTPVTNLLVGYLMFSKHFDWLQISAAFFITGGVCFATLASADSSSASALADAAPWSEFLMGFLLLLLGSLLGSIMSNVQEATFVQYGKNERECVFYSHVLTLPLFISRLPQMAGTVVLWSASTDHITIFGFGFHALFFWLVVNILTQYLCIHGVFLVFARTNALTLSLVLALRKFVSLLLSVFLFNNPFTVYHQLATALVFGGSIVYSFRTQIQQCLADQGLCLSDAVATIKQTK